jgi:hypothetical protein
VEHGATDLTGGFHELCANGHVSLVPHFYAIQKVGVPAIDVNQGLLGAAKGGHSEVIHWLCTKGGATELEHAHHLSTQNGHTATTLLLKNHIIDRAVAK